MNLLLYNETGRSPSFWLCRAMVNQPQNLSKAPNADSTLVPMLIWGLVLIVIGMASVMIFV